MTQQNGTIERRHTRPWWPAGGRSYGHGHQVAIVVVLLLATLLAPARAQGSAAIAAMLHVAVSRGGAARQAVLGAGAALVQRPHGASVARQARLIAAGGKSSDRFGVSLALSRATVVVGAYGKNGGTGAAYVFVRSGTRWRQQAVLMAADGARGDLFGTSVALSGNTAVIGAESKNGGTGAAYVFVRSGTRWRQQAKLTAADGARGDLFGKSAALSGNTAVIGAVGKNGGTGAAYVFVRSGTRWHQQTELTAADGARGDYFGTAVALSGATALVGAVGKNGGTGAAYVFARKGTRWRQRARLMASGGTHGDAFGTSIALGGAIAIVGAVGKNGNTGVAYVFAHKGTRWQQQARLTASDGRRTDYFGVALALSGAAALVGAAGKNNGTGAAYVFVHSGAKWRQQARLMLSGGTSGDAFGASVGLAGATAVIGAAGTNGDTGAAYVFVRKGVS